MGADIFQLVAKKYAYDILKALKDNTKRFKNLKEACEGEKMRAQRLKELEDSGLITVDIKRIGRRPISLYKLSKSGREVLEAVEKMRDSLERVQ